MSVSRRRRATVRLGIVLAGVLLPAGMVEAQTVAPPAAVQPASPDSTRLFGGGDWVLVGSLLAAQVALFPLDDEIQGRVRQMQSDATDDVAAFLQPLGHSGLWLAAAAAALTAGQLASERRLADVGLHALASLAAANIVTGGLKALTGRWRPRVSVVQDGQTISLFHDSGHWHLLAGWRDGEQRRSYPSGHATAAFAVASVLSEEFGGAIPWVAYPLATGVAWSRLNDDHHWATDVIMGGLIGILSGRLIVRLGRRRGGWLERMVVLETAPYLGRVALGLRVGLSKP